MKSTMKLSIVITSLLCSALYSAEKSTDGKLFTKEYKPELQEKFDALHAQHTPQQIATEYVITGIELGEYIPVNILQNADPETATLARQHNQKLQQQLQNQEPK